MTPPMSTLPAPSAPLAEATAPSTPTAGSAVLDRLALRVRDRVTSEQSASAANPYGDGAHAASLPFPWPY
ncbi:HaaA family cyclophane-containing RiPP peptide [Streptomyces sp. NBC_01446]|uniref:HaaA family cyclophane-containing RiPP peptide n=1 Tax=Streptomyces sp. NBC_01446 TaxID=2903870 RepID=UPI00224C88C5|nr:HaaA family cyclophane-containing RiPP peptide [Streptomyces sp. NBC_01446]MCX4641778.1 hypothetical protein [Streptomyces sp. NBC_01446]